MRNSLTFKPAALKKLLDPKNKGAFQEIQSRKRQIREKGMNKRETAFSLLLEAAKKRGEILQWHFETVTLKVSPSTRYIPDFVAVLPSGHWQVFEIKGFLEDDAAVKFKGAAEKFPELSFHMLKLVKGQWVTIYNLPSKTPIAKTALDPETILKENKNKPCQKK